MFEYLVQLISSNAQLLSGIAALIGIIGVVVSPIGSGLRMLLRRNLRQSNSHSVEQAVTMPRRARPSVAVMPFKNTSGDVAQDYLADGLTEDIITTLSYASAFDVIARNSTFAYKNQTADVREVGAHLGATYVVEGSLRTVAENVRVTVQVNDAETGSQIWAEKFERRLASFLEIQDDVVNAIACQICPEIERVEQARDKHLPTGDLGAWALVRRASTIFNSERNNRENLNRVIEFSKKAIALDPNYSEAYGFLSRAYSVAVIYAETEDSEADLLAAEEAYQRIRELAPNYADTFFTQGQLALAKGDPELALTAFKGAYERNPNNVLVLSILGLTAARLGYAQDGIDLIERALQLSPHDPSRHMHHFALANAAMSVGDTRKALSHAKQCVDLFGDFPAGLATYASVLLAMGRDDEARVQLDRIRQVSPGTTRQEMTSGAQWIGGLSEERLEDFDRLLRESGFD